MWCWRRMKRINWSEKVTNEKDLELIEEKRTLLNILSKSQWVWSYFKKKLPSS